MIAFKKLELPIENYYAYEIDKYAIKTSLHNFPEIKQCGDVFDADFTQYKNIDYLIGGSPCTYWSIAQSPDRRETTASGIGWELFSQYVKALHIVKPKFFIYENNKSMSKDIYKSISETFGFEPICINSALVSAQNRQRLYWVGKIDENGKYTKVDIEQPEDRGILLRDVLDRGQDLTSNNKSYALTASYDGAVAWNTIERNQRSMVVEPVCITDDGKSQTLKAQYCKNNVANFCCYTSTYGASGVAELVLDCKQNVCAIPIEFENRIPTKAISSADGKIYKVYHVQNGKILIKDKEYPIKLMDGYYIIRKLTVSECKRLQTVPDWFEFPVSDTQAYKCLGNGWTVDVIVHLIKATL